MSGLYSPGDIANCLLVCLASVGIGSFGPCGVRVGSVDLGGRVEYRSSASIFAASRISRVSRGHQSSRAQGTSRCTPCRGRIGTSYDHEPLSDLDIVPRTCTVSAAPSHSPVTDDPSVSIYPSIYIYLASVISTSEDQKIFVHPIRIRRPDL